MEVGQAHRQRFGTPCFNLEGGATLTPQMQVINAGDCMEFLSGGRYKATIHRVVQPPVDQQGYERVGAFYFAFPDENVKLVPLAESPVLQRVGITRRFADAEAPTVTAWRKGRTAAYGITQLKKSEEKPGIEEEYISGILVEHYN